MKNKILITRKISDVAEEKLKSKFDATLNLEDIPIPYEELINKANEYDGMKSLFYLLVLIYFTSNLVPKNTGLEDFSLSNTENLRR